MKDRIEFMLLVLTAIGAVLLLSFAALVKQECFICKKRRIVAPFETEDEEEVSVCWSCEQKAKAQGLEKVPII